MENPGNLKSVFSEKSVLTFNVPEPTSATFSRHSSKRPADERLRKMAEIESALIDSDIKENGVRFKNEKYTREVFSGKRKAIIDRIHTMTPPLQSVTI